jgi:hypothetical protein
MTEKQTKVVSIIIQSHLHLQDFTQLIEQLNKLEGFAFVIKSKIYTLESLKDEKVIIESSDMYSDMYNMKH